MGGVTWILRTHHFPIVAFDLSAHSVVFFHCVFPVSHFTMNSLWEKENKQLAKGKIFHVAVSSWTSGPPRHGLLPLLPWDHDSGVPTALTQTCSLTQTYSQGSAPFLSDTAGPQALPVTMTVNKKSLLNSGSLSLHVYSSLMPLICRTSKNTRSNKKATSIR